MAPARPVLERFLEKIGKPDAEGCCRWLASHNRKEARKKNENFGDFAKVISSVSGISSKCPPSRRGRSRARHPRKPTPRSSRAASFLIEPDVPFFIRRAGILAGVREACELVDG